MKKQLTSLMEKMLFGTLFPSRTSTLANLVLPYIKDKDKVLDLGPRTGKVAEYIVNHRDIKITLLDVTDEYRSVDLEIEVYNGETIPYKNNSFDCVLVISTLHHCDNPDQVIKEAARVSKDKILIFEDKVDSKIGFFLLEIWHTVGSVLIGDELFYSFKKDDDWRRKFKTNGLKFYKTKVIRSPWYKPTKQILYVLKK